MDGLTHLLDQAVQLAERRVVAGGIPFAALVADPSGEVLGSGVNRVRDDCDPSAHAEVVAIRKAGRALGSPSLSGATLVASGEPCGMCYTVARVAGVARIAFAVDRHGAAEHGFDYRHSYALFAQDPTQWPEVTRPEVPGALRPFKRWRDQHGV